MTKAYVGAIVLVYASCSCWACSKGGQENGEKTVFNKENVDVKPTTKGAQPTDAPVKGAEPAGAKSEVQDQTGQKAPDEPTFDTCEECEEFWCTDYAGRNLVEGCHKGNDKALCEAFFNCAVKSNCAVEHPNVCYCGDAEFADCLAGKANGPCKAEVEAAAKTTTPTELAERYMDTTYPVGDAAQLLICRRNKCKDLCFKAE